MLLSVEYFLIAQTFVAPNFKRMEPQRNPEVSYRSAGARPRGWFDSIAASTRTAEYDH